MRRIPVTLSNADTVAHDLANADFPIIILSRHEIESGLTGDALARLMAFSDTPENVRRFEGTMRLFVSGYNDDSRELFQIPEVCTFVRGLTDQWPHWLHFLSRDSTGLGVVLPLLIDMEIVRVAGDQVGVRPADPTSISRLLRRLFDAMNALHAFAGLGQSETMRSTDEVMKLLSAWMGQEG